MEARRPEKVCADCRQKGSCKRSPDWHEDTERYDCSEYKEEDDGQGKHGDGIPGEAE